MEAGERKNRKERVTVKIALCQNRIVWEEKEQNLKRADRYLADAGKAGAGLVFFPEMSFTGFSMNTGRTAESVRETVETVRELAQKHGIAIGFGWVEKTVDKARNHYTVVDNCGNILSDYVKIHPFSYSKEDQYFEAGQRLSVFSMGKLRIGTLICYDLRFPELFQVLAEQCDLIVVAANWPCSRREHWKCLLQARAIECQAYLAGVNCCGEQEKLIYTGDSCVFSPDGANMTGFREEEGLIVTEIPENTETFRKQFPTRQDRNWPLYRKLYREI